MLEPYDPMCNTYAKDMEYLDPFWAESREELDNTDIEFRQAKRVAYVRNEEGTLNPTNGHFLCDSCYIKAGQPSSPTGWVCP